MRILLDQERAPDEIDRGERSLGDLVDEDVRSFEDQQDRYQCREPYTDIGDEPFRILRPSLVHEHLHDAGDRYRQSHQEYIFPCCRIHHIRCIRYLQYPRQAEHHDSSAYGDDAIHPETYEQQGEQGDIDERRLLRHERPCEHRSGDDDVFEGIPMELESMFTIIEHVLQENESGKERQYGERHDAEIRLIVDEHEERAHSARKPE